MKTHDVLHCALAVLAVLPLAHAYCSGTRAVSAGYGFGYSNYDNNCDSSWVIFTDPGNFVEVRFPTFDTELHYDGVILYDGPSSAFPELTSISGCCSYNTWTRSTSNYLTVRFVSDEILTYDGFSAETRTVCQAGACDDGNVCTQDSCNAYGCYNSNQSGGNCNDYDGCTTDDTCDSGTCAGTQVACDDGEACTDDACFNHACVYTPNDSNACDDGNPCTDDACVDGSCVPTNNDSNVCDDGNPCTDNACVSGLCTPTNNDSNTCDDGNPCTDDACVSGLCTPTNNDSNTCDDANPCTDDVCVSGICTSTSNDTNTCEEGNLCSTDDFCDDGICHAGPTVTQCNDINPCTDDACIPATGLCEFTHDNSNACEEGDLCSTDDYCEDGICYAGPTINTCDDLNACTDDVCIPATGLCNNTLDDTNVCSDGNDCTDDMCVAGVCVGAINDSNTCDDAVLCTVDDHCDAGVCIGTASHDLCDDGDKCTSDTCDAATGCVADDNGECGTSFGTVAGATSGAVIVLGAAAAFMLYRRKSPRRSAGTRATSKAYQMPRINKAAPLPAAAAIQEEPTSSGNPRRSRSLSRSGSRGSRRG